MPTTKMSLSSILYVNCTEDGWTLERIADGICPILHMVLYAEGLEVPDDDTARRIAKRLRIHEESFLEAVHYDYEYLKALRDAEQRNDLPVISLICHEFASRAHNPLVRARYLGYIEPQTQP